MGVIELQGAPYGTGVDNGATDVDVLSLAGGDELESASVSEVEMELDILLVERCVVGPLPVDVVCEDSAHEETLVSCAVAEDVSWTEED